MKRKILNAKGQEIVLNAHEEKIASFNERRANDLGYEIDITTLTSIMKEITEQKFYHLAPGLYMPVRVGEGAWSASLTTYRSFELGGSFADGVINTGGNNGRLAVADAGVDALTVPVINWAKSIGWTLIDLQLASKSGNWDLVSSKERSRKTNWDLGIQQVSFMGLDGDAAVKGLLNQSGITVDTSLLPGPISSLGVDSLKYFCANVLGAYRGNNGHTAMPNRFTIPEFDFLGLAAPASAQFPIKSTLDVLLETFRTMTGNPDFQILPCVYAQADNSGLSYNRYALYNSDPYSLVMQIPVDYQNTLANSLDGFGYQNVGYGQFSGVLALRPQELYYIQYDA